MPPIDSILPSASIVGSVISVGVDDEVVSPETGNENQETAAAYPGQIPFASLLASLSEPANQDGEPIGGSEAAEAETRELADENVGSAIPPIVPGSTDNAPVQEQIPSTSTNPGLEESVVSAFNSAFNLSIDSNAIETSDLSSGRSANIGDTVLNGSLPAGGDATIAQAPQDTTRLAVANLSEQDFGSTVIGSSVAGELNTNNSGTGNDSASVEIGESSSARSSTNRAHDIGEINQIHRLNNQQRFASLVAGLQDANGSTDSRQTESPGLRSFDPINDLPDVLQPSQDFTQPAHVVRPSTQNSRNSIGLAESSLPNSTSISSESSDPIVVDAANQGLSNSLAHTDSPSSEAVSPPAQNIGLQNEAITGNGSPVNNIRNIDSEAEATDEESDSDFGRNERIYSLADYFSESSNGSVFIQDAAAFSTTLDEDDETYQSFLPAETEASLPARPHFALADVAQSPAQNLALAELNTNSILSSHSGESIETVGANAEIRSQQILSQVVQATEQFPSIRDLQVNETRSVQFRLDPEQLGELSIEIERLEQVARINIVAERSVTQNVLERNIDLLIQSLEGTENLSVEVNVSHRESDQGEPLDRHGDFNKSRSGPSKNQSSDELLPNGSDLESNHVVNIVV